MKLHKIRGVVLNVCSAEQKIAYNIAFSWALNGHDVTTEKMLQSFRRGHDYKPGRFDEEAIAAALAAGYPSYLAADAPVASSYEQVGQWFPLS